MNPGKIALYFIFCLLYCANIKGQIPSITSFSPQAGKIGDTVTINGNNFSPTASNNIVFFGPVKAKVIASTINSLKVSVPLGASFTPIVVTVNRLTAYSQQLFTVLFDNPDTIFTQHSFEPPFKLQTGSTPVSCTAADITGDGKVDLIAPNYGSAFISVYKNISQVQHIEFSPRIDLKADTGTYGIAAADLDGDGKIDIIATNRIANKFSIFKNISTVDSVIFLPKVDYIAEDGPRYITISDFDNDGKPDLAISVNKVLVRVYKNSSNADSISFVPYSTLQLPSFAHAFGITSGDFDGDGKPDLALALTTGAAGIFRNNSSVGNISFENIIEDSIGVSVRGVSFGDLDGDGKVDLAVTDQNTARLIPLKNNSTPGSISFDTAASIHPFVDGSVPNNLSIDNLDGDDKPDIALSSTGLASVGVLKNISSTGNLLFKPPVIYSAMGGATAYTYTGDIDGDGKPDIIAINQSSAELAIFRNKIGQSVNICSHGNAILNSNITGNVYKWQISTDSLNFTDLLASPNYSGVNTPTLHLFNIPSSSIIYQYRCIVDTKPCAYYTLQFANTWTNLGGDNSWENPLNWSCNYVPDENTDVEINSGTVTLNSNTTIRSLKLSQSAKLTVSAGKSLTVTY